MVQRTLLEDPEKAWHYFHSDEQQEQLQISPTDHRRAGPPPMARLCYLSLRGYRREERRQTESVCGGKQPQKVLFRKVASYFNLQTEFM